MNEHNTVNSFAADVVVLGSGSAALVAALSAHEHGAREVIVVEKSGMVGGTSAMSGGMMWIPLNHLAMEAGVRDSFDDVVTYLDHLAPGQLEDDPLSGFLEGGPEMIRFLADKTPVRLRPFLVFPDYQPDAPGAMTHGGRSLDNDVFAFEELGSHATRVNPPKTGIPKRTSRVEDRHGGVTPEMIEDRIRRDCRGQGQALIGSLFKGILDRGIPVHYETRARHLVVEDGRVVGVDAEHESGPVRYLAHKGVVIATGGFEWNEDLVRSFLRGPMTGPISVPECEGDGLLMAMEVGASLGNMAHAWWMTSSLESKAGQHRDTRANYLACQSERTAPGSIMVNRQGKRFVNEAVNYNALGFALHNFDPVTYEYPNLPYWLIFNETFMSKYRMFTSPAGTPAPAWAITAETLDELARLAGIDADGLVTTVERFNGFVRKGHDDDFCRGDTTYDNFAGDKDLPAPFGTLGLLEGGPYYAIKMEAGVNGTCGGPRANANAQVLGLNGAPIPGLYVCSNTMSAVTAGVYGGAGGTLGPGSTFGYLAGKHAARS
ncbi:MAG: FAD-binding protein [Acidimicrobiia bacterium]|nr:FAD-binding protein [Acidimicrobiia bacterium]